MKGSIRLIVGLILVLGGVGGIESNTVEVLPLDSMAVALVGLLSMGWAVVDINKEAI